MILIFAGEVTGECTGPQGSVVPVSIEQDSPETGQVMLTPRNPGPHTLSLHYAGFPLPFSPLSALAEAGNGGVRLILTGKGLATAVCNQIAEFNIDGSQAGPGKLYVGLSELKVTNSIGKKKNLSDASLSLAHGPEYVQEYAKRVEI